MTHKGKSFVASDAPRSVRRDATVLAAWIEKQNARYEIIATDPSAPSEKQDLILEELEGRMLATLSPKARRVVGMMMNQKYTLDIRKEILACFDSDGEVVYPFDFV